MTTAETLNQWPADGLETIDQCPVCASPEREIAHDNCRDVTFGAAVGEWTVWQCASCGSGYLNPRPTPDTIGQAYSVYYTHASRQTETAAPASVKHKLISRLKGSYINAHYGRGMPSFGGIGALVAQRVPELSRPIDNTYRFTPFPVDTPAPCLLDVGCGNGDYLKIARAAGWKTFGSDPDPSALDLAAKAGADVRAGGVEVWSDMSGFFDAITMNHVIEHLHTPAADLSRCFDLLKPGGTLYIETPNFDAYGRSLYGPFWRGLEVPRHLAIFNWRSLRAALERCGFVIEREIRRDNFLKQCRRSARAEIGVFEYEDDPAQPLRLPSDAQIAEAKSDPARTEWLGFLARRPKESAT